MTGSVTIVGGGRVGQALGRRVRERGWKIGDVVARSLPTARRGVRFIGAGQAFGSLTRQALAARVFVVATPDRELANVAQELARIGGEELREKIVLHTSGALDSRVFDSVRKLGAAAGSMHPLQSFSGFGVPPLEGRVFAIEGDPAALRAARQMARSVGGMPLQIEAAKKPLYHAACALAAGHALALIEAATRLLISVGMKRRQAVRALLPLTRQVFDNFERLGAGKAWTGPLSRGDYGIIAAHAAALHQVSAGISACPQAPAPLRAAVLAREPEEARRGPEQVFCGPNALKISTTGNE